LLKEAYTSGRLTRDAGLRYGPLGKVVYPSIRRLGHRSLAMRFHRRATSPHHNAVEALTRRAEKQNRATKLFCLNVSGWPSSRETSACSSPFPHAATNSGGAAPEAAMRKGNRRMVGYGSVTLGASSPSIGSNGMNYDLSSLPVATQAQSLDPGAIRSERSDDSRPT
jgi:hypothetical protein